jgi:thiamine transport system substrate-binding protein
MILSACGGVIPAQVKPAEPLVLRVMVHDSFAISSTLVEDFEIANNMKLEFIKGGDSGTLLNKALLTKDNPLADVIYGIDNSFLSRALENDLLEIYKSPTLVDIPIEYQIDKTNRALPVDYGDVCINYDKAYFQDNNLPIPQKFDDLLEPDYAGLLVMENPATSSPGLAFLLATISKFGEYGYLDYWRDLKSNGLVIVNDWETAYYTNFSGSSGKGLQAMVVSYGSSPAAEVVYAAEPLTSSPTASITGEGMCNRQVEFIGILKGTPYRAQAEQFIDFMLSISVQEDIPLQMFVFPANSKAALPDVFMDNVQIPDNPVMMDPDTIHENREKWLDEWTTSILR